MAVQQQPEVSKLGREVFDAVAEPGSGASPEDQLAKLREQCVGAMGKVKAEAKSEKEREKRENKEKAEAKLEKERGKIEKAEAKSEKEREKREKKEEAESQKEKEKRRKLDQGITATAVKAKRGWQIATFNLDLQGIHIVSLVTGHCSLLWDTF